MSDRKAIRELQIRLASRLQTALAGGGSAQWLAVKAAGVGYLLPLSQAGEIFSWPSVFPLAYTHDWFLGVANLRGNVFGVIDLAAFLSGRSSLPHGQNPPAESRLVAMSGTLDMHCALLVEQLSGLKGPDAFSATLEKPSDAPDFFGSCYTDSNGLRWQEINLQTLSQRSDFLTVGS